MIACAIRSFLGLRDDKKASEVVREEATVLRRAPA